MSRPDGDAGEIFKRRTAVLLGTLSAVSLVLAIVVSALSSRLDANERSSGTDAFSESAIGYRALLRFLEHSGVRTLISRSGSSGKARPGAPLFLGEPHVAENDTAELRELLLEASARGAHTVVVLPKWRGTSKKAKPTWVERVAMRPKSDVALVLRALDVSASSESVVRPASATGCASPFGADLVPELRSPQLVALPGLEPIVSCAEGVLVAHDRERALIVVADPDLLNTSGLGRGGNAALVHALFLEVLGAHTLVVDEALHGFRRTPSLLAELFEFPLLLVTIHFAGFALLAGWKAMGRFGKPLPVPPRLAPGKMALVDNTAELIAFGGFSFDSLLRYFRMTIDGAAAACALPHGLPEDEVVARLSNVSRSRGLGLDPLTLADEMKRLGNERRRDVRKVLALGSKLYLWRKEIARGR